MAASLKFLLFLWGAACAFPAELTTGALLGDGHDARAFYTRENANGKWMKTGSGAAWRPEAAGKLMNLRIAQGLFHDEWLTEVPFDPDKNTAALIDALDFYKAHGVLMVDVSLQGGQAGYDPKVNGVARENGYRFGREKGTYVSAFNRDGSLKPAWMARLERLLRAADTRGMFVNVMYFYQGQDESLDGPEALHAAARNITQWFLDKGHRNVFIDVANEYDLRDARWDFDRYIPNNVHRIVREVDQLLRSRKSLIAVAASSDGRMQYPEPMMSASNVVLIHGNNRTVEQKVKRAAELADVRKPVLMNEDDNGRASTLENLAKELASCDIFFKQAAGWGYMPWVQAQRFPFRYLPSRANIVRDADPERERDMAYFHAVLDHIAALTLKNPPHPK
jgi:hypothetical protein